MNFLLFLPSVASPNMLRRMCVGLQRLAYPMVTNMNRASLAGTSARQIRSKHSKRPKLLISASLFGWLGINSSMNSNDNQGAKEPSPELLNTIRLGILEVQEGNYVKAETILHTALTMAQKINHRDGITYVYTLLASLAYQNNDYMKAEKLYKTIIERLINKGVDAKDNSIIEMSLRLAVIYGTWKEHGKAETGFKYCIDAQESKMKSKGDTSENTHALWGMSRDWYAQYLLDNGRYQEAFSQFQEAFLTSCELFGDTHPQTLVVLNSLGTVCSMMGDDVKAVSYFNKAVALGKATASENLSTFLVNLGMAKIKLGLKGDANNACQEALLIGRRNNLSEVCTEAEECIKMAT